jgi:hypothetical protein
MSADAGKGEPATGIYEAAPGEGPLQQGEILSAVIQQFLDLEELRQGGLQVNDTNHPFVIVASQCCDLQWDYEARRGGEPDKLLPHVMLCEALTAEEVKGRKSAKGEVINNSTLWGPIKKNKDERFHFFEAVPGNEDADGQGLPELVVDFKRCFSMPTAELYWKLTQQARRRTRLKVPYLEHFATRLFQYQARVATPRQHLSV